MKHKIESMLYGFIVGDCFGVPYEFLPRAGVKKIIKNELAGYGTHHRPPGTWSDDTSLTLALMDSLDDSLDLSTIADAFVDWYTGRRYLNNPSVFDIGRTTDKAIRSYMTGIEPGLCGGTDEYSNGNGSLMRISPLAFRLIDSGDDERRRWIFGVSGITHGHNRSKFACWLYVEILINLIDGRGKEDSIDRAHEKIFVYLEKNGFAEEAKLLERCDSRIAEVPERGIDSTGYVISTLEAVLWAFLTSRDYEQTILTAAGLGNDTDTVCAITGSLAGLYYGKERIPRRWIDGIKQKEQIEEILCTFYAKFLKWRRV